MHPIVKGALTGILSAATVDIIAFRSFKTVEQAAAYDWRVAIFRWVQGAVSGALAAAGLGYF